MPRLQWSRLIDPGAVEILALMDEPAGWIEKKTIHGEYLVDGIVDPFRAIECEAAVQHERADRERRINPDTALRQLLRAGPAIDRVFTAGSVHLFRSAGLQQVCDFRPVVVAVQVGGAITAATIDPKVSELLDYTGGEGKQGGLRFRHELRIAGSIGDASHTLHDQNTGVVVRRMDRVVPVAKRCNQWA